MIPQTWALGGGGGKTNTELEFRVGMIMRAMICTGAYIPLPFLAPRTPTLKLGWRSIQCEARVMID